ncbi:hypothetical protein LCGC14_0576920 [marine sediment metagenome]|uniref:Uncharacterized protein n=1 Tax=marine sediment metagenome TaxID=412755 RepID=A0A0F9RHI6_9ZZZZ
MKNELIIINKIDKKLQEKRDKNVFPLAALHRKELRQLRDSNIGNLRDRLKTIKELKKEEYIKKYSDSIKKGFTDMQNICDSLNKDWKERIQIIQKLLQDRKDLEDKSNVIHLKLNTDYSDICELKKLEEHQREFYYNEKELIKEIGSEGFENKFSKAFDEVTKRIDNIHEKYEEAINFGDLEIVKELYYIMKKADGFFVQISNLKV